MVETTVGTSELSVAEFRETAVLIELGMKYGKLFI